MSRPELAAFAANLRAAMSQRGVGNDAIAAATDVTRQQVSAWRNGHHAPSARSVAVLEQMLNLPSGELLVHLRDAPPGSMSDATDYNERIARLPEHVRRTIDDLIDSYE